MEICLVSNISYTGSSEWISFICALFIPTYHIFQGVFLLRTIEDKFRKRVILHKYELPDPGCLLTFLQ